MAGFVLSSCSERLAQEGVLQGAASDLADVGGLGDLGALHGLEAGLAALGQRVGLAGLGLDEGRGHGVLTLQGNANPGVLAKHQHVVEVDVHAVIRQQVGRGCDNGTGAGALANQGRRDEPHVVELAEFALQHGGARAVLGYRSEVGPHLLTDGAFQIGVDHGHPVNLAHRLS